MVLIVNNIFLSPYDRIYKAMSGVAILVVFSRIQSAINPYENPVMNEIEQKEMIATVRIVVNNHSRLLFFMEESFL